MENLTTPSVYKYMYLSLLKRALEKRARVRASESESFKQYKENI